MWVGCFQANFKIRQWLRMNKKNVNFAWYLRPDSGIFIIHVTSKYPACYCGGGKTDRQHTDIRLYVFCSFFMFTVVKLVQNMNLWLPHSPARPTDRLPSSVLIFFCEHCRLRGVVRFSNPEGLIEIDCIFPPSVLFSEPLTPFFFCEHCRLRGVLMFSNPEGLIEIASVWGQTPSAHF